MKSQSAMEYLMTYGWAILIIAIGLVALFSLGVFSPYTFAPKAKAGSCQIVRPTGLEAGVAPSLVGTCTNEIPESVAKFSGGSDIIYVGNNASLQFSNDTTIALWMKPYSKVEALVVEKYGGIDNGWIVVYSDKGNGTTRFDGRDGSGSYRVSGVSQPIGLNTWSYVTAERNGSVWKIYVNGVLENSTDVGTNGSINDNLVNATIGKHLNGSISNVQIYSTALPSNEIAALYNEGIGGKPIDLRNIVGWWPLNGNTNDYSGNRNGGTPSGVIFISNWESGYTAP